ncbi:MAG TPA: hypothetical protein VNX18_24250 [Bryobacteraceae bacterium]|jgi:hypothetical protein|nr:hypothetical protein [Bryobacteraceae bacterium]
MKMVAIAVFLTCLPVFGFVHHATAEYKLIPVQGHAVYLSPEAVADGALLEQVVAKLDSDLAMIQGLLPKAAVGELVNVAFWIEHDNPETPGMTYHPNPVWLKEHGYNTDKAKSIEIGNLQNFLDWHREQPFFVLHELSHAYHDRVLGNDNPTIRRAYELAVASHKYESVGYVNGQKLKAYALNNAAEYFAELSEAYWGKNDFYPFVRGELETFDLDGFQMVAKLWLGG